MHTYISIMYIPIILVDNKLLLNYIFNLGMSSRIVAHLYGCFENYLKTYMIKSLKQS